MIKIRLALEDTDLEFCLIVKGYISIIDDIELVGIANDGLEAFELIKQKHIDVLLLHNVMPSLDGLGVLARLQNLALFKKPKIIIINDSIADDFMKVAYKLGADYEVSRRIDIEEIIKCVRMVIKKPTDNITQTNGNRYGGENFCV
jgi:two-component system response regulator (stage 0 sporulation protein A)